MTHRKGMISLPRREPTLFRTPALRNSFASRSSTPSSTFFCYPIFFSLFLFVELR